MSLHFAHYNLVRRHQTLRVTPAMAAGVASEMWSMDRLLDAALAPEGRVSPRRRGPGRPRLPKGEARGATLSVRLTPTERAAVERAARSAGLSASDWARNVLCRTACEEGTREGHHEGRVI